MSGLKDIVKGGWHPGGKDGKKESWRGDFKGINTVAGWMGKGKDPHQAAQEHQSTPLSALRDPASFGPPPKHINYRGAAAVPNTTTPDGGGLGAPLSQAELHTAQQAVQAPEPEEEKPASPAVPFRADTTGLSTANLPKPPVRRVVQDAQSSYSPAPRPKPNLPPRLPPRQNSHPDTYAPPPPPTYHESVQQTSTQKDYLNQGALNRLGQAGVSVPGLNIGRTTSPPVPPRTQPPASPVGAPALPQTAARGPQLSELQARFSKMSTTPSTTTEQPGAGTSFAQKQATLKTANALRDDPSSVSLSDMRSAASTANNFRERHGEQVSSGLRAANGLNQKYGVVDRVNGFAGGSAGAPQSSGPASPTASGVAGKKAPPPPPPKKREFGGPGAPSPPPIPLSSKPRP